MAAESELDLAAGHSGAFVCESCHMRRADVQLPCRHRFHARCVFQWPCTTCPACQRAFSEDAGVRILPLDNWAPPGASSGAASIAGEGRPLRSGRWNEPEAEFAAMLVADFTEGTLPLAEGTKLGNFLCNLLMCSSTRLSKKLKSGKKYFRRKIQTETLDAIRAHRERQRKISEQEELFLLAVANFDGGVDTAKMLSEVMQTEWREQFIGHAHGCRQVIDNAWQWNARHLQLQQQQQQQLQQHPQQPAQQQGPSQSQPQPHASSSPSSSHPLAMHLQSSQRSRVPFHQVLLTQQRGPEKLPSPMDLPSHHPASPASSHYHLPPMHPGSVASLHLPPMRSRYSGSPFPRPGFGLAGEPHSPFSTGPPLPPHSSRVLGSGPPGVGGPPFSSVYDKLPPGLNEPDPASRSRLPPPMYNRPPYSPVSYGMVDPLGRKFFGSDTHEAERMGHFHPADEPHLVRPPRPPSEMSPQTAEWHHGMSPLDFSAPSGMASRPIPGSAPGSSAPWHLRSPGRFDFGHPSNDWMLPQVPPMSSGPASPQSSVRSGYQPPQASMHHSRGPLEEGRLMVSSGTTPLPWQQGTDDMSIFLSIAALLAEFEVKGIQDNSRHGWMQALPEVVRLLGHLSRMSAVFLFSVETQTILYASGGMSTLLGEDPSSVVGANPITSGLIHPEDVNHFITTALDCCQKQRQVVMSHAVGRSSMTPDGARESLANVRIRLRSRDGRYHRRSCSLFATDHIIAAFCAEEPVRRTPSPGMEEQHVDARKRKPSPVGVTSTHADSLSDEPPVPHLPPVSTASTAPPKKRATRTATDGIAAHPSERRSSAASSAQSAPTPSPPPQPQFSSSSADHIRGYFHAPAHLDDGQTPFQTRLFNAGIQQLLQNLPFDAADVWIPQRGSTPSSITLDFGGSFARSALLAEWGRLSVHAQYPPDSWLAGLVLQRGQVRWIEDIEDFGPQAFGRGDSAARFGIRTAVAIPLAGLGKDLSAAGVLVLYSQQSLPQSEAIKRQLLEIVSHWSAFRRNAAAATPSSDAGSERGDEPLAKAGSSSSASSRASTPVAPAGAITSSAAV